MVEPPAIARVYGSSEEENVMSDTSRRTIAKESVGWSIGLSLLMIVAGLLAIALPQVAGITVSLLVAWLLVLCGVAHLVFAWHRRTTGGMLWELLLGVLYVGVGVYVWLRPVAGLATLTLLLAIYLFAEGVLEFVLAFVVRPLPGSSWLILDGIVTLILGVLIWKTWPSSTEAGHKQEAAALGATLLSIE
jgi:uncharacterized membrane protein HdeD (DUF308 family)